MNHEERIELAERIRGIMIRHGEPIKISQICEATGIRLEDAREAAQLLILQERIQPTSKGWRAI